MGYILNVDLETTNGPSQEVYVRIENFAVNRVTSKARFQLTYWIDKDHATRFNKTYVEEEDRPMVGLIRDKVIYYENDEIDNRFINSLNLNKVLLKFPLFRSLSYHSRFSP